LYCLFLISISLTRTAFSSRNFPVNFSRMLSVVSFTGGNNVALRASVRFFVTYQFELSQDCGWLRFHLHSRERITLVPCFSSVVYHMCQATVCRVSHGRGKELVPRCFFRSRPVRLSYLGSKNMDWLRNGD